MAAYTHHAEALGATSADAYTYINSALQFLAQPAAKDPGVCEGIQWCVGGLG